MSIAFNVGTTNLANSNNARTRRAGGNLSKSSRKRSIFSLNNSCINSRTCAVVRFGTPAGLPPLRAGLLLSGSCCIIFSWLLYYIYHTPRIYQKRARLPFFAGCNPHPFSSLCCSVTVTPSATLPPAIVLLTFARMLGACAPSLVTVNRPSRHLASIYIPKHTNAARLIWNTCNTSSRVAPSRLCFDSGC